MGVCASVQGPQRKHPKIVATFGTFWLHFFDDLLAWLLAWRVTSMETRPFANHVRNYSTFSMGALPIFSFFPKKLFQWFIPSRRQEVTTDRLWRLFWTFCFHIKSSSLPPQGSGITKLEITRPEGVELDYYLCSGLYSSFSPSEILYSTNSTRRLFSDQHKRIACFPNYKSTAAGCVCLDVLGAGRL